MPTPSQRMILNEWFGTAGRHVYNEALKICEADPSKRNVTSLQQELLNSDAIPENKQWMKNTPYDVRYGAVRDLLAAYKGNFTKMRQGDIKQFSMSRRSKKDDQISIEITKSHFSKEHPGAFYADILGHTPIQCHRKSRKWMPTRDSVMYNGACRLVRTRDGKFYLMVPQRLSPELTGRLGGESQAPEGSLVALDPGVRTFMTGYSPSDDTSFEFGKGDMGRIARLAYHSDRLQSKADQLKGKRYEKKRAHIRRAGRRINTRIRCLVDEVHCKLAVFLCRNYRTIIIPEFNSQGMVKKGARILRKKTVRALLTWSHYKFRKRLENKAEVLGCRVVLCNEAYTSKTCTRCGYLHSKLGGAKLYRCPRCHLSIDRDVNGARNIALRALLGMT